MKTAEIDLILGYPVYLSLNAGQFQEYPFTLPRSPAPSHTALTFVGHSDGNLQFSIQALNKYMNMDWWNF